MYSILGAGLNCVDLIYKDNILLLQNGGTCSNVLSVLSRMGWLSTILMAQYQGVFCNAFENTFTDLNVKLLYYKKSKKTMPEIIEFLKGNNHTFKTVCPTCERKISILDLPSINDIKKRNLDYESYDLFFHDRVSAGINYVIEEMEQRNKLIMYEPNSFRNAKVFLEHCQICDIVKFSGAKIPMKIADEIKEQAVFSKIKLIINTNGENGLVFSYLTKERKMSPWQRIPPFISKNVYDTSGAGDWFTAGFLNALFKKKINLDIGLQEESIVECINEAKKMAKICCSAIGAQGAFYNSDLSEKIKKGMPPINTSYPLLDDIIYEKDGERCPTCLLKY